MYDLGFVENSRPIQALLANGVGSHGVDEVLRTIRRHLGMDIAFISHFREKDRIFEYVDSDVPAPIHIGQSLSLEEGYCLRIVRGELPGFIPNTARVAATQSIPATHSIPIGAHLSVPVLLSNGKVYGTLCCFSFKPDETLGDRDMQMMEAFAEVLATRFEEHERITNERKQQREAMQQLMQNGLPSIVFQPIYDLASSALTGFECLSRFNIEPRQGPDAWFAHAHRIGLGQELEAQAIHNAVMQRECFSAAPYLAINGSPEIAMNGLLEKTLDSVPLNNIVLEVTEHAAIEDYASLSAALELMRRNGLRLAIDDAGAGYASMRHILQLQPDFIKLDMTLTRNIDTDTSRRALARALISFAHDTDSLIVAEGVETVSELETLRELGVDRAQGYFLSKPLPLEQACQLQANVEKPSIH